MRPAICTAEGETATAQLSSEPRWPPTPQPSRSDWPVPLIAPAQLPGQRFWPMALLTRRSCAGQLQELSRREAEFSQVKARLQSLTAAHPQLDLCPHLLSGLVAEVDGSCTQGGTALSGVRGASGSVHLLGSGTFAAVWGVQLSSSCQRHDSSEPQRDQALCQQPSSSGTDPSLALKVLQLPVRLARQQRFWPRDQQPTVLPSYMDSTQLQDAIDTVRWRIMFAQEFEGLITCAGHPSIVRCLGHCFNDSVVLPTLAMEFAGPYTLAQVGMTRRLPGPESVHSTPLHLDWAQASGIYFQLLDAIDWLHWRMPAARRRDSAAVFCMHRDLSPANIMLDTPFGPAGLPKAKIVDFGLCHIKPCAEAEAVQMWRCDVVVGPDVLYIDPVMHQHRLYSRGTDIFGVGQVLLMLLFGWPAAHLPNQARTSYSLSDQLAMVCAGRDGLRARLRLPVKEALQHLHPRWRDCPTQLLQTLLSQAVECTSAGDPGALLRRPTSRELVSDLVQLRSQLPSVLQALLPSAANMVVGTWPGLGPGASSEVGTSKLPSLATTPSHPYRAMRAVV
ncbi:kinase-like domain-containing protein [Haematococcus lacustris]